MKKVIMEPPERLANLQTLWDSQTVSELGPCGMYFFKKVKYIVSGFTSTGKLNSIFGRPLGLFW